MINIEKRGFLALSLRKLAPSILGLSIANLAYLISLIYQILLGIKSIKGQKHIS